VRELATMDGPVIERLRQQKLSKLPAEARMAHQAPADARTTEQANLVLETEAQVQVTEKEIAAATAGTLKARRGELVEEVRKLPKPPAMPMAMALARGKGPGAKTFVLSRGEYGQPGDEVQAGFPTVLPSTNASGGSRAALADWIASPGNPLTARVMVNRIWQHHFGRGIVTTPSDFGTRGQRPTHPELLNWLASEFVNQKWTVKAMHRLMLTSMTYRQASASRDGDGAARDPENRFVLADEPAAARGRNDPGRAAGDRGAVEP